MSVYGYCRCGERVERNEYREHVLTCPAHEEDSNATDTLDEGAGAGGAGSVEPAEVDQVRADIVTGLYLTQTQQGWLVECRGCRWDADRYFGTEEHARSEGRFHIDRHHRADIVTGECERSAGDGGTCADEPDADLMGWCDTCTFRPGDRVYVTDPALAELRAIMARYGENAPPNHHGTVDDIAGDELWIEFDDGQVSLYPVAEVHHLREPEADA